MKPKVRVLLEQCIENGIKRGYYRAHKHTINPSEEVICASIEDAVMGEIHEWFDFDEIKD
jgi:hypothetical protein